MLSKMWGGIKMRRAVRPNLVVPIKFISTLSYAVHVTLGIPIQRIQTTIQTV